MVDVTGTRTFAYSASNTTLTSETLPSYFSSRVLTRKYDTSTSGALGRNVGYTLSGASGSGTDQDLTYGYDASARFNSLAVASGPSFTYAFASNSNLVGSITEATSSGWTETMAYESNRNLLASITGKYGTTSKATFAYEHDVLGRRKNVIQSGEVFARYSGSGLINTYEYNDRSELTAGQSYHGTSLSNLSNPVAGRGFGYAFDNIGNRTSSTVVGADSSDVRTTNYTSNKLNQVTVRDAPASTDVTGLAPTNASVTVNSAAATRQAEYFFKNVAAGSRPLWQSLATVSTLSGTPTTTTRYSFIPAANEAIAYDLDGNITSDGRWTYTWDAENRLLSMETTNTSYFAHDSVNDARRIDFAYDYLGRRVEKYVRKLNGSAFTTDVAKTRFVYNGWNVVAELNGSSLALQRTNAWGLDLSGTLTDGGGVGGLLAIKDGSTFHLPVYDANGNVAGLVDKAAGTLTAAYEYSPFGESLRATGTYATANNFRFSTKYTDQETGLAYYGYRYYDAKMGRFLGRDPSGEQGGLNLYGFCNNNPVNCYDVLGLVPDRDYMYQQLYGAGVESDSFLMSCTDEELTTLYLKKLEEGTFDTLSDPWGGEMPDISTVLNQAVGTWRVDRNGDATLMLTPQFNVMGVAQENSQGVYVGPIKVLPDGPVAPKSGTVVGATPDTSFLNEINPFNPNGSFARNALAVSDSLGGMLGVTVGTVFGNQHMIDAGLGQMAGSYNDNVYGQTVNGPAWSYYGTRTVMGIAIGAATVAGVAESGVVWRSVPLDNETRVRIIFETVQILATGEPGGPGPADIPRYTTPPSRVVPVGPGRW